MPTQEVVFVASLMAPKPHEDLLKLFDGVDVKVMDEDSEQHEIVINSPTASFNVSSRIDAISRVLT